MPAKPELVLPRGARPVPTHTRLHTRRVPVAAYIAALLLIPGLVVGGFIGAGWWTTTGRTATAQAGGQQGEGGTGVAAPAAAADVKGSMTVQQVVDAFAPVTAAQVFAQFGAPLDTSTSTPLKTLVEAGNGTDIPALRTWLQGQTRG
jgi:hypothetical protein